MNFLLHNRAYLYINREPESSRVRKKMFAFKEMFSVKQLLKAESNISISFRDILDEIVLIGPNAANATALLEWFGKMRGV